MSNYHKKPISYVAHAEIKVVDLNTSIPFYTKTLGFSLLFQDGNVARLGTENNVPLVTLRQLANGQPKAKRTAGLYHFALLLPSRKDLGKILLHFIKNRVPLQGASNHGISEAIYLADPDGNGIEIATDTDPATWPSFDNPVELFSTNGPMDVEAVIAASEQEEFKQLPGNTLFGHIHLHVGELEKTKEFYTNGLGMDLVMEFSDSAMFFSYGKYHHHLAANLWNGRGVQQPKENSVGLSYLDLVLGDEKIYAKVKQQLNTLGYPVTEKEVSLWTQDPSGNNIRITV